VKNQNNEKPLLILVTGVSGAGKTTALDAFSDMGFFAVYNLPVSLLSNFVKLAQGTNQKFRRSALRLEIEAEQGYESLSQILKSLEKTDIIVETIFLDCSAETAIKRYSETRRPHPAYDSSQDQSIADTVKRERLRLLPFKENANQVIDTSQLTVHDLKRELKSFTKNLSVKEQHRVRVNFLSFGFKHGLPRDCDIVIDVRFLPNPNFIEGLKELSGRDQPVIDYIDKIDDFSEFLERYSDLLNFLLPKYIFEGKSYLNIGVGCTGGRHRSVAIAEKLAKRVQSDEAVITVKHRDIER